jgi:hypothetical protein
MKHLHVHLSVNDLAESKHWLEEPQGIVWEAFHTMGDIPVYGAGRVPGTD